MISPLVTLLSLRPVFPSPRAVDPDRRREVSVRTLFLPPVLHGVRGTQAMLAGMPENQDTRLLKTRRSDWRKRRGRGSFTEEPHDSSHPVMGRQRMTLRFWVSIPVNVL
jgi:hypothetical protein